MEKMTEIRWHGRAGQGVVSAADMLAQVIAKTGKHVQAFPEFGAEKRGAPVCAFDRISDSPIRIHSRVENPDIVTVLDPTLMGHINISEGTPANAPIIINTNVASSKLKKAFELFDKKLYSVDAYEISLSEIGRPIPNTPMLGALIKVTKMVELDLFLETIQKIMEKKFNQKIIQGNIQAIKRAYNEVSGE